MKKSKLTLGLVTSLLSIGALAGCNEVTYSDGVVLEYTDAQGKTIPFTAEELFGEQYSSGIASTDFDSVYEVLIRKYYQSGSGKSALESLKALAQKDVQDVKDQAKKNADNNGTSYQEEFSKLLESNSVENVQELYDAKLFEREKKRFEDDFQTDEMIEKMRDGTVSQFKKSDVYGAGSDGYLVEQMPYTISHILVKLGSATNGEHAQATISEAESRKLGQVIELLAGAKLDDPKTASVTRSPFGNIAQENSEDTGSAAKYGQLDVMDRDQADSFINEFKFGIYTYEAIYNQVNTDPAKNAYAAAETAHANSGKTYALTSKIKFTDSATYTDRSFAQTADEVADGLAEGEHYVKNYFDATKGGEGSVIRTIPYGAAVALAREDVAKNDFKIDGTDSKMNWDVNGNSATFFPRNILFNKYFNNHKVAVIVPNEIPYNDPSIENVTGGDYTTENFAGVANAQYAALPGFQYDTSDVLPGLGCNALTTEKGQIILAVRGGSSGSYEGIHLMVIDRSALEEYVKIDDDTLSSKMITADEYSAQKDSANVNSLSEFYTIHTPKDTEFPTYTAGDVKSNKTTYVNQLHAPESTYSANAKTLRDKIKGYNSNKDTFMFQQLIEDDQVAFMDNPVAKRAQELIESWIRSKRNKSVIDAAESFDKTWSTYIEYLTAMDEARALNDDGSQRLISETCAIGYNKTSSNKDGGSWDEMWKVGGACYAK